MNPSASHYDIVIIGAGISGIGTACRIKKDLPDKTFVILEGRETLGGTWDLFRYPGIRSDSDIFTFGYEFRPWRDNVSIVSGKQIMTYLRETVKEHDIADHIKYGRRVVSASWSSKDAHWILNVKDAKSGEDERITCSWIFAATGYYKYDEGYTPRFAGTDKFKGRIVHPQHWPADLDYRGKKVVVIGSGATAVTLVPALASSAEHVVQLQRTPTYVVSLPSFDMIAAIARRCFGDQKGHAFARWKNIWAQRLIYSFCQKYPKAARKLIRYATKRQLPADYPVDKHFNPPYNPWDQRLCLVPDGDFFKVIREGQASVVTDKIRTFTESGIELESGRVLEADIIITATGLNLLAVGGIALDIDGRPVRLSDHIVYRGIMLDGVPNLGFAIGYTNASWTLKIGLLAEYFIRLIKHMDAENWKICTPKRPDGTRESRPLLDFSAGYIQRSITELPGQGTEAPWKTSKGYFDDVRLLRHAPVQDGWLDFKRS